MRKPEAGAASIHRLARAASGALLLLAAASVPARGAPPEAVPPEVVSQFDAFTTWVQRIVSALSPANAAVAALMDQMKSTMPVGNDPAQARAAAARLSPLIAEARQKVLRARDELAAIPTFRFDLPSYHPPLEPQRLLDDSRAQASDLLSQLDNYQLVADALARGDSQALKEAAVRLIRGGVLIMRGQALIFRNRQAAFPPSRSPHQVSGISAELYETMGAVSEAWVRARVDGEPGPAAAALRARLSQIAVQVEALTRAGRQNLAHEQAELAADARESAQDPQAQRLLRRVELVAAYEEKMLAMGDELAAWARQHQAIDGAALEREGQSDLFQLAAIERRMVALTQANAAALAGRQD
ncbi:MAG: hypothetical protein QOJ94_2359 [Sphingomonadales bacterium]|jgi:hypothetical protein|nr:hypothetical protein [Sphingomonadales bacterium]